MADSHSEPEKYSLDEMMERLGKSSTSNETEGELVTRADGTQALKVRKRKRRTEQPIKAKAAKTRKIRIIQVTILLILMMILGLGAAGLFVYSNSAPFRTRLLTKISQGTGASADVAQFRVTPLGVNSTRINLQWPENQLLQDLALTRVKADLSPSSYFGKSWSGNEAEAVQATLVMKLPPAGLSTSENAADFSAMHFNRLSANQLNITLNQGDSRMLQLNDTEGSFYQNLDAGNPELRLNKGSLSIANWPTLNLDRASITFQGNDINIGFLRLATSPNDRGTLALSGKISPYSPDTRNTLDITLSEFKISELMGSMSFLLPGKVDTREVEGSNTLTFGLGANPDADLKVSFASSLSSTLGIERFPFLYQLSRRFDDQWFLHPIFESKAIGQLERKGKNVMLTNLELEHRGKIAIVGNLSANQDEVLSGNLDLGVSPTLITNSGDARLDAIFSPVRDGFRWISLKASGIASDPNDNFESIYLNADPSTANLHNNSQAPADKSKEDTETAPELNSDEMWKYLSNSPR
ncbi:hypothetical protein JIN85_04120 [Luteolibacter pohnpeiensis]|uniref:AsmA-like C-terminal domain-containing protein n=1 Tax=Luteolibacter pohnpeiensis TaxID=454153 RepID=A0A934VQ03_9BACT|nr:hypothetical protein [Luteolibacter pohnpeiensis]MBK1881586.1 hypothetical protein [Luteolibacter pohnpeiensis]